MIDTPRLTLRPATAATVCAEIDDHAELQRLLGVRVPENWPPEVLIDALPFFLQQLQEHPELECGWWAWYIILKNDDGQGPALIGGAGFKGPAASDGVVETGYSVLPQYQNRGYVTEAVQALIDWAFRHPEVSSVIAHTLIEPNPSVRVLTKLGFCCAGEGDEFGTLRFELVRPTTV